MENLKNKNLAELFEIGINLSAADKTEFINKINVFDKEKAHELLQMFSINPTEFGIDLVSGELHETAITSENELQLPDKIDKYNIISILGIGGMGIVYLGERSDINQSVAIKVANSLIPQGARVDAITHEAKILASLQHPNIASLVDWGVYETNRHFVATEFIDGQSINIYCQDNNLEIIERIRLFVNVVDAVDYAHNNLVIHRDIKPNNILVEQSGIVKLIDFGVSRLMEIESGEHQQTIGAALTPSYASPEQLRGESLSIRSDIYSLGRVLLNLLVGTELSINDDNTPFNIKKILSKTLSKFVNQQKLKDIILVINKSIESDQNTRYHNAHAFKQDLQAILDIRPIKARAPSRWYQFRKLIARNRLLTTITFMALVSTFIGIGFGAWQLHQTKLEKEKAMLLSDNSFNYSKLLEKTLMGMEAFEGGSASTTMGDFMQRAVKVYKNEKKVTPRQLSYHAHILSKIYNSWGKMNKSLEVLNIGLEYAKQSKDPADDTTLLGQKANIYFNLQKYQQCIQAANESIAISEEYPKIFTQKIANQIQLSQCYASDGQYEKSIKIAKEIIENKENTKLNIAYAAYGLGMAKNDLYELEDSVKYFKMAEKLLIELTGKNSGMVVNIQAMIFYIKSMIKPQELDVLGFQSIIDVSKIVYGQNHPNTAEFTEMFAFVLYLNNQLQQAINLQKQVVEIMKLNNMDTYIVKSKLRLIRYYLISGDRESTKVIFDSITGKSLSLVADNYIHSLYYKKLAWLELISGNLPSAQKALAKAKVHISDSGNQKSLIEIDFRNAQFAALQGNWKPCYDNAQKASNQAKIIYPKTWQISNAYQYLQDVCENRLTNSNKNTFPYLEAVNNSPWKFETQLTNKIKLKIK